MITKVQKIYTYSMVKYGETFYGSHTSVTPALVKIDWRARTTFTEHKTAEVSSFLGQTISPPRYELRKEETDLLVHLWGTVWDYVPRYEFRKVETDLLVHLWGTVWDYVPRYEFRKVETDLLVHLWGTVWDYVPRYEFRKVETDLLVHLWGTVWDYVPRAQ